MGRKLTESFASGLVPYSEHERERADESKRRRLRRGLIRRRVTQHGHYDVPGTEDSKKLDLRKMGESL